MAISTPPGLDPTPFRLQGGRVGMLLIHGFTGSPPEMRPLAAYLATGEIPSEFWVFPVAGAIFIIVGFEFLAFSVMSRIARLLWEREKIRSPGGR